MAPDFSNLVLIADECPLAMSDYLQLWKTCLEKRENHIIIEKSHPNLDQLKISLGELQDLNFLWYHQKENGTLRINMIMKTPKLPDND